MTKVYDINKVTITEDNKLTRKHVECRQSEEHEEAVNQAKRMMENQERVRNNLNSRKHKSEINENISRKKPRSCDFALSIIEEFDKIYYDPNKRINVDLKVNDDISGKS